MIEPTITDEELAEIGNLVIGNATTLRRLIAALRAKDQRIADLTVSNEELARAVRLADQEADEIIAEMGQQIATLTARLESAERMRETSRLRAESLEERLREMRGEPRSDFRVDL